MHHRPLRGWVNGDFGGLSDPEEPTEEYMSPAEWLADIEVAVTASTPDPLAPPPDNGEPADG
jgi:hypothetical protein